MWWVSRERIYLECGWVCAYIYVQAYNKKAFLILSVLGDYTTGDTVSICLYFKNSELDPAVGGGKTWTWWTAQSFPVGAMETTAQWAQSTLCSPELAATWSSTFPPGCGAARKWHIARVPSAVVWSPQLCQGSKILNNCYLRKSVLPKCSCATWL